MDDELEKKQTFLRTNILEKGYDAEEFMNFLQSKKGEMGLDLNNWNLDELDIAVKEFISSLDKDNILINPQNINKEEENQKNNEEINNFENNDNNLNNNNYQEKEQIENEIKDENDFIECEKIIPNPKISFSNAYLIASFKLSLLGKLGKSNLLKQVCATKKFFTPSL